MFLNLWSEISLFHILNYDIAQGSILIGLGVAVRLLHHRLRPNVGSFSTVKSVIKIKLCFYCFFASLTCDKKNLK